MKSAGLTLTFATPHTAIFNKTTVSAVILPGNFLFNCDTLISSSDTLFKLTGSYGDYGINPGHSQLISQLDAGVVSVTLLSVLMIRLLP